MNLQARRPFFMQFSLHIESEIELKNFSLSQLIVAINELFTREGLPGFLKVFLQMVEIKYLSRGVKCPGCSSETVHRHTQAKRRLKTTIGEAVLLLSRYRCQSCKKTFIPMNQLLDLDPYSRKSREFEKLSLETVTQQSFRRSADHLDKAVGFETSFTTLHRWFMATPAVDISVKKRVKDLLADGTGYKMISDEEGSNRGEIKVVMGITSKGEVVPYGAWTRANWKDIGSYIKKVNHHSEKTKFKPIANTLITDGEEELVRRLKKLALTHQRCLFHMTYELTPLLRYQDYVSKEEAIKLTNGLSDILYIELPETDADPLKNMEDKLKIEIKFKAVKEHLESFISELKMMGYKKAITFIENSKNQLFTYIENWIKTGISNPKATSLVERMMREIKRRIRKIGFSWSEKGAEKMTRLVLLQLSSTKYYWQNYWNNKIGIDSNTKLRFLGVTVKT
jgi:transposase-like protein